MMNSLGSLVSSVGERWPRALSGQADFAAKGDNAWGQSGRNTLCWPYGLSISDRSVAIPGSGDNRVLLWDLAP